MAWLGAVVLDLETKDSSEMGLSRVHAGIAGGNETQERIGIRELGFSS